jgi:hypothetical protein
VWRFQQKCAGGFESERGALLKAKSRRFAEGAILRYKVKVKGQRSKAKNNEQRTKTKIKTKAKTRAKNKDKGDPPFDLNGGGMTRDD